MLLRSRLRKLRAEEVRAEAARAEAVRAEAARAEAVRAEAVRAEEARARAEAVRAEAVRAEEVRAEAVRAEAARAEAVRAEAVRAEAARAEAVRAEEARAEAARAEAARAEAVRAEAARAEAARAEAARAEAARAEAARAEAARAEAARAEAALGAGNWLYIHVPKTGGSSIEAYLANKYNTSIYVFLSGVEYYITLSTCSKQHYTLLLKLAYAKMKGIILDDSVNYFGSVRNPYTRAVSDLYHYQLITRTSSPIDVEKQLETYINQYMINHEVYDNHVKPQYLFFVDHEGVMDSRVKIIKQETLCADMRSLGFSDFKIEINVNSHKGNYYKQLTMNAVHMLNKLYKEDFTLFNYTMIHSEEELSALQKLDTHEI